MSVLSDADRSKASRDFSQAEIESIEDPIARLRVIMKRLLDPGGCPWDREQSHETLKQYMIEEAYEACEAIDSGDAGEIRDELGDVALQVVFHAELAERAGRFKLEDVYEAICGKLIYRHPHVFGDHVAETAEAVLDNWEHLKTREKQAKAEAAGSGEGEEKPARRSAVDGVPRALPALQRAHRLQDKASRVGFDWDRIDGVAEKVREEVGELLEALGEGKPERVEEEFGDLLFSLVNLSRFLDILPEEALGKACSKFRERFQKMETIAAEQGRELKAMTLEEMDAVWDAVKSTA